MASQITINSVSGATNPYVVYVCDINGNNCKFLSNSFTPPKTFTLNPIFDGAPSVMLKIIDFNNCEVFTILNCQS